MCLTGFLYINMLILYMVRSLSEDPYSMFGVVFCEVHKMNINFSVACFVTITTCILYLGVAY